MNDDIGFYLLLCVVVLCVSFTDVVDRMQIAFEDKPTTTECEKVIYE